MTADELAALDYAETALSEAWAVLQRIANGETDPRRIAADLLDAHGFLTDDGVHCRFCQWTLTGCRALPEDGTCCLYCSHPARVDCTCGEAWSGHANPHASTCPGHVR